MHPKVDWRAGQLSASHSQQIVEVKCYVQLEHMAVLLWFCSQVILHFLPRIVTIWEKRSWRKICRRQKLEVCAVMALQLITL